jgi:hypothetical protein
LIEAWTGKADGGDSLLLRAAVRGQLYEGIIGRVATLAREIAV